MIQEYRKLSAEALGLVPDVINEVFYYRCKGEVLRNGWHPDLDANQMLMVEDWFREHHVRITYDGLTPNWQCQLHSEGQVKGIGINNSKFIAFMDAFLQYFNK